MNRLLKGIKIVSVICIILSMSLSILYANPEGSDNINYITLTDPLYGDLQSVMINDSIIISNTTEKFIIQVIDGYGYDRTDRYDLDDKFLRIDSTMILHFLMYHTSLEFDPSTHVFWRLYEWDFIKKMSKNDHFSLEFSGYGYTGWIMDNITVWDEDGIKFRYQTHCDSIDLGQDGFLEIDHYDILHHSVPINESMLVIDSKRLSGISENESKSYWSPFHDRILDLNATEISDGNYHVLALDDTELKDFYYESYLLFKNQDVNVTIQGSKDIIEIEIGDHTYIIISERLSKTTWLEHQYSWITIPPPDTNTFAIIRK